jgi:soluble lytic murein transglycosylase-like protein
MLPLKFTRRRVFENKTLRSCFILIVVMPAFAASSFYSTPAQNTTARRATVVVKADSKTGRLIRSVVLEPKAQADSTDRNLARLIDNISAEQGVESHLVHSVIRAESNYDPTALSPKGAQGMMQLIPATARRFGVSNAFDPDENIRGGVRYLRFLLDYYQGDYVKTIAAYNAGEGAVDKYHGIPPYLETQKYVYRVARNLKAARESEAETGPAESASNSGKMETTRPIETSTDADGRVYYRTP